MSSLCDLGERLGYALLGTDCNLVNAFFLRTDLLAASGFTQVRPEDVYHYPPSFPRHPYRPGPYVSI